MNVALWILLVAGGWLVLAAVIGTVVGRVIRNRDRQIPRERKPPHVVPPHRIDRDRR